MTYFFKDVLRQPEELRRTLDLLLGRDGGVRAARVRQSQRDAAGVERSQIETLGGAKSQLDAAVAAVQSARHVYLSGIGSSWHAGLNVSALFQLGARPVYMVDAAELVQFAAIPAGSVLIVISRSGRRVDIVHLLTKAR